MKLGRVSAIRAIFLSGTSSLLLIVAAASAQQLSEATTLNIDNNGVDLSSLRHYFFSQDLAIGNEENPLSFSRTRPLHGINYYGNYNGGISVYTSGADVTIGDVVEKFALVGGTYTPINASGSDVLP